MKRSFILLEASPEETVVGKEGPLPAATWDVVVGFWGAELRQLEPGLGR